ncbi:MAG TPA: pseudouridine synthase [Anaerolineales bacterium]|nr:pseudouridine synthase [Anaerolineales bacterium]
MEERLQKILAQAGYGSRRHCEEFITGGRVQVNGRVAAIGEKADPDRDKVTLDGKPIARREALTYIAMYKPRNVISSVDDEVGRKTVRELIPESGHLYPVGRLDWDSEGLILMTNDGDLTNRLTHPRYGHQKEYRVLLARQPDAEQIGTWRRGVILPDGEKTAPADVYVEGRSGKGAWLRVTMGEGKKRQIREIGQVLGLPVVRIIRIRIGTLRLGSLKPGDWRHLTQGEIDELKGKKTVAVRQRGRKSLPKTRPPRKRTASSKPSSKPGTARRNKR